jgi:hypothetical protein
MTLTEVISLFARFVGKVEDVDISQTCGLTQGTDPITLQITRAFTFFIGNSQIIKDTADLIPMDACSTQVESTFCYYTISIDAAGSVAVTKGPDNGYALPSPPLGGIPIGALKIETDSLTSFTSGTTPLNASGIISTYYDIDVGIARIVINAAIRRMETMYNFRCMRVNATITTAQGTSAYANPITGYKELESAVAYTGGLRYPLSRQSINFMRNVFNNIDQGTPKYIAEVGASETVLSPDIEPNLQFMLGPVPDSVYTVIIDAFQYTPELDGVIYSSNWWTKYQWNTLLYEALVEVSPYLKEDERADTWRNMSTLSALVKEERTEQFSGSRQCATPYNIF